MFGKYTDLAILIAILAGVLNIFLAVLLLKKQGILEAENENLKAENRQLSKANRFERTTNARIFTIIQLNTEDITCLRKQMQQVHGWLGDVLTISNLIGCDERESEKFDIIEDLRQRVAWNKEVQKNQKDDDSNYYKGN